MAVEDACLVTPPVFLSGLSSFEVAVENSLVVGGRGGRTDFLVHNPIGREPD